MAKFPDNLRVVFFGNTKYSVIVAKALEEKLGLSLIVTINDRPTGRKRKLTPNPVKQFALNNNVKFITADKLDEKTYNFIKKITPDFLVVTDYGLILPKMILALPKFAALNIHHSLLPKYRGPSPVPATILNGDKKTGVTIISMTEKVDAGDILAQKEYVLKPTETTDSLLTKLNTLGGQSIINVIENYLKNKVKVKKQDSSKATYTRRFTKEDGKIDIKNPPDPQTFDRMIRAFYPWPGVWTKLKTHNSKFITIKFLPKNLIQPEGKKPMTINEFLNGHPWAKDLVKKLNLD